jgi:hypothetical protein
MLGPYCGEQECLNYAKCRCSYVGIIQFRTQSTRMPDHPDDGVDHSWPLCDYARH